jgi:hypothetical protein
MTSTLDIWVAGQHLGTLDPSQVHDDILSLASRIPDAFSSAATASVLGPSEAAAAPVILDALSDWTVRCIAAMRR